LRLLQGLDRASGGQRLQGVRQYRRHQCRAGALRHPAEHGFLPYGACGGYTVEGHVPAREIRRLLREKPVAVGLAAPGMPIGSPGMDTPAYNGKKNPYNVMLIAKDGSATVYQKYEGNNL
jgi:hypothetical protein